MIDRGPLKNKFFLFQFVVFVKDMTKPDDWEEGYIYNIHSSLSEEPVYSIDVSGQVVRPYLEDEVVHVIESQVFSSRRDMYLWRAKAVKEKIDSLSNQLKLLNDHIKEEEGNV